MTSFYATLAHRMCWPLLLVALTTSACDSSGDSSQQLNEVAGEYTFATFRFTPESSLLTPVNMLDTLDTSTTRLQLFSSGRFTLMYHFLGGKAEFIGGDFTVTDKRVRLNGAADEKAFYEALLLSNEITLNREGTALTASIQREVNLEEFSPRYKGLPSVSGTLTLRLERL